MTHDPVHAIFLGAGAIYFAIATYYSARNFKATNREGFWFMMTLFSLSMTGAMISGTLWSAGVFEATLTHPFYDTLFLLGSLFLAVGTYTLGKKHHDVRVY